MNRRIFQPAGWLMLALVFQLAAASEIPSASEKESAKNEHLRVAVVGDTGIGERAFHRGFLAVQKAITEKKPDVLLHLGDFVYQPDWLPKACGKQYLREIRATLVDPFPFRLFVPGDNDLPPHKRKPKASGCWSGIDPLDTPFDKIPGSAGGPAAFEGTRVIGNTLFGILNTYPWTDPTPWLKPRIEQARRDGLWVILGLHEPAVTTAWFLDKRQTVLKQLNELQPDLVFSGNQHSYERFYPMGTPRSDGVLPLTKSATENYRKGDGTIHIITGGGGATFKPFADLEGNKKRTAPPEVFEALARRALMNHFLILDITPEVLKATTYRVCPGEDPSDPQDPRWRPRASVWENITLECEGKDAGVSVFDRFEIRRSGS